MFFLTEVDTERANIRGSRDPLGLVPVWGAFGRKIVGNLTTASTTVRGFTTVLLGFHFAERIRQRLGDGEADRLAIFMRFEQLAGFVRKLRHDDDNIRGITEIKRRLSENGTTRIRIGSATNLQILSNQKTYGLWGLYTVPAIDSDWLVKTDLVLTEAAQQLVRDEYLPVIRTAGLGDGRVIEDLLSRPMFDFEPNGKHQKITDALAKILTPRVKGAERKLYHYHLVEGGPSGEAAGWQPRFAELVEETLSTEGEFDHAALRAVIKAASGNSADAPLKHHLEKIRDIEALLMAMANLFGFLQERDNAVRKDVLATLRKEWKDGLTYLRPAAIEEMKSEITEIYGDPTTGARLSELAQCLNAGAFAKSVDLLLEHNRYVMKSRHGSEPWIQWNNDKLSVRYRDEGAVELASPKQLSTTWRSGFYLNPLKTVSDQLSGA